MPAVENPTKMDDVTVKKLEEAFSMDCSVEEACLLANISKQTYYNWVSSFPDMKERFDVLRQYPILKARKAAIEKLDESYQNAMDYLSRKRKDEFSTKSESKVDGNIKYEIVSYEDINPIQLEPRATSDSGIEKQGEVQGVSVASEGSENNVIT